MTTILIPAPMRAATNGLSEITLPDIAPSGTRTVGAALRAAGAEHTELTSYLFDDKGALRRFVNVFIGEDNIRDLDGLDTPVSPRDEIAIIPAVAGGAA